MITKRKKNTRQRGSKTHGWGAKKKHRGAGNRGGRGKAGTGKRADQKKPTILKKYGRSYFGKFGFKKPNKKNIKAINLEYLEKNFDELLKNKLIKQEKDTFIINLKDSNKNINSIIITNISNSEKYHSHKAKVKEPIAI